MQSITSNGSVCTSVRSTSKTGVHCLTSTYDAVMVFTSDGNRSADLSALGAFKRRVIVEQNGRIEQGSAGGGARSDLTYFLPVGGQIEVSMAMSYVKKGGEEGLLNLDAKAVPGR